MIVDVCYLRLCSAMTLCGVDYGCWLYSLYCKLIAVVLQCGLRSQIQSALQLQLNELTSSSRVGQ